MLEILLLIIGLLLGLLIGVSIRPNDGVDRELLEKIDELLSKLE
jgi:hypothetical protein